MATYKIQTIIYTNLQYNIRVPQLYLYIQTINLYHKSGSYINKLLIIIIIIIISLNKILLGI